MMSAGRGKRVIVVGAGIAGLLAARHLTEGGLSVTVFEKSAGVGGRMATRRIAEQRFDHGAQYFRVSDSLFDSHVQRLLEKGVVQPWSCDGLAALNGTPDGPPLIGRQGMTDVARELATGLDIRLNQQVERLELRPGGWRIWTDVATYHEADGLILTAPVPQTINLLQHFGSRFCPDLAGELAAIRYQPLFALLVRLNGPSGLQGRQALELPDGDVIGWLADNGAKYGVQGPGAVTVHAGAEFSENHVHEHPAKIRERLWTAAAEHLDSEAEQMQLHRWRYAWPINPITGPRASTQPAPMALAGDGFGGVTDFGYMVEAAALSGISAAASLFEMLVD